MVLNVRKYINRNVILSKYLQSTPLKAISLFLLRGYTLLMFTMLTSSGYLNRWYGTDYDILP